MAVEMRAAVRSSVRSLANRGKAHGRRAVRPLVSREAARRWLAAAVAVGLAGSSVPVRAADLYWDINGATDGAGGSAPSGAWTGNFWSNDPTGLGATGPWSGGNNAVFSAGTDANGAFTVNVTSAQTVGNITAEEGAVTLGTAGSLVLAGTPSTWGAAAGASLFVTVPVTLAANTLTVDTTGNVSMSGLISGTGGLNKAGTGTLTMTGATSTFTGNIAISGGVLEATLTNTAATPLGGQFGTVFRTIAFTNNGTFRSLATYNDNVPSATNTAFVFNFGSGGGTLDVPTGILTLDDGSGTGTASTNAQLQGSGQLTKTGAGTLSLGNGTSNFANFTGAILISAGTLTVGGTSGGVSPFGATTAGTTIASGATFDLNGSTNAAAEPLNLSGNGLITAPNGALFNNSGTAASFAGPVTLAAATSIGGTGNTNLTGVVSGAGQVLTKVGTGTLTLSGNNTYSGGTTVSSGTLATNNTGALGTGAVTVAAGSGAVLTVNSGTTLTVPTAAGPITLDGGTLTSTASPTLFATITNGVTLSGASAATVAPGGIGAVGSLRIGTLTTAANSTLNFDLNGTAGTSDLLTVTGSGGLSVAGGTTIAFNTSPTAAGSYRLIGYAGTAPTLTNFVLPAPNARTTYNLSTSVDPGFISLVVTNGGVIATNWTGTGAGPNDWTNAANWSNGIPGIAGDTANFVGSTGATNQVVNLNEQQHVGTLTFNNPTTPTPGSYTLAPGTAGGLYLDNGAATATVTNAAGSNTISAPVTLVSNSVVNVAGAGNSLTVSGAIGTGGFGTLTKGGTGTLVLGGVNTYTTATTINAGTVRLANGAGLGSTAGATTVAAGAALDLGGQTSAEPVTLAGTGVGGTGALVNTGGAATLSGAVTLAGDTTFGSAGSGTMTVSGAVGLGANNLTVDGAQATTISGLISGAGSLVKVGAGNLTLSNTGNTFTGPIAVNAGTLSLAAANNAGVATNSKAVTVSNGATLAINGTYDPGVNTAGFFTGTGGGTFFVGATAAVPPVPFTFTLNDAGQFGGTGNLTKTGLGLLVLGQTTTPPVYPFTGGINLTAGTIRVLNQSAFGTPTGATVAADATLDLQGITTSFPVTLNGVGQAGVGALANAGAAGLVSTLSGPVTLASASTVGGAGNLTLSGGVSGTGPLTKIGAGVLALSGPSTYSGGTVVSAGTVNVSNSTGSATGTGNVTLNAGTLQSGPVASIAGSVLAGTAAHVITPGGPSAVGTLTLGGLTTSNLTTLNLDVVGPGNVNDLIAVTGGFTAGTGTILTFNGIKPTTAGNYRLFDYNEAGTAPTLTNFTLPTAPNGRTTYSLSTSVDAGYIDLVVAVTGGAPNLAAWIPGASGRNWNDNANWTTGAFPTVAGDTASFTTSSGTVETVNLNVEHHVSALTFNNAGGGAYTLAAGTAGVLALDNGGAPATVTNTLNNNVVSAPVQLASNVNASVASGTTLTVSGVVSGPRSLTVTADSGGTLALTNAANTFTGGLNINGGAVTFAADLNLGAATNTVTLNGGTLRFAPTGGITLAAARNIVVGTNGGTIDLPGVGTVGKIALNANQISGSGTITKTGGGDLQITGAAVAGTAPSPFTGTWVINGLVEASVSGVLGTGNVIVNSPGEVAVGTAATLANPFTVNGGTLTGQGGTAATLSGPVAANGPFAVAVRYFNTPATSSGLAFNGPISGTGNMSVVYSTGTTNVNPSITLAGDDSAWSGNLDTTGATNVNGVAIKVASPTALGNTTGSTTIVPFAQLDLNGINYTTAEPLFVGGTGPAVFPAAIVNRAAGTNASFAGPITLTSDTLIGDNTANTTIALTGPIGGGFALTKNNPDTVFLSGASTYSGGTTITGGTLSVSADNNLGADGTGITFNGGTLQVTGTTLNGPGSRPLTFVAAKAIGFDITAAGNTYTLPDSPALVLGQTLVKSGAGKLVLTSASNTVTQLNVNAGTLDIGATSLTVNNGGGDTIVSRGTTDTQIVGTGTITLGGAAAGYGDNAAPTGTTLTIVPKLTAAASVGFEYFGAAGLNGTVVLANAANDFTGVRLNSAGTVSVAGIGNTTDTAGYLGQGSGGIALNATGSRLLYTGAGETTNRVIDLQNNGILEQGGTGLLKLSANLTATGGNAKTLTLQGSTAGAGEIAGVIPNNSTTNTTAILKAGTGIWTLSGSNTYSGGTTVSGGTLLVNNTAGSGSGTGTGPVTVGSGGTLGGGGTIAGAVTITAGGSLTPGNSPGVLSIAGNLILASGATFSAELGGTSPGVGGYDQARVTGVSAGLSLASATLSVSAIGGFSPSGSDVYYLLTQAGPGSVSGTFAGAPEGATVSLGNGLTGKVTYLANWTGIQATSTLTGGNDVAVFNVVPEPTSAGLLGMAAIGLLARRRRRAGR